MGKRAPATITRPELQGWTPAPLPASEPQRLSALRALDVLDTAAEPEFDALVRAAAHICRTPIALISLVDERRQWFKANLGLEGALETPRELAFCAHAIQGEKLFQVNDAIQDSRFAGNPLVVDEPSIRFYAGAPIRVMGGQAVGTLCVLDREPRQLDARQIHALECLAHAAARALEGRYAMLELRQRNALLHTTLSAITDAVLTADVRGCISWLNPAAERMLRVGREVVAGQPLEALFSLRSAKLVAGMADVLSAVAAGRTVSIPKDTQLLRQGAQPMAVEGSASPLEKQGTVLVLRDVTSARETQREIAHRAMHDALTGLFNRYEFDRQLKWALDAAAADGTAQADCVLFLDLDHFKVVNDTCGHAAGDQLLKDIAELLRKSVRAKDTVARLGGDEFAILLRSCPLPVAERLAKNICHQLDVFRFEVRGKRLQVGVSIGLAALGEELNETQALMRAVDECCYAAKSAGRNRVVAWTASAHVSQATGGAASWAERIGRALDEDRFVLMGQLVIPLHADAGDVKVEMLLRMLDESGQRLSPGEFIPAAERFHLMGRIDRWVLRNTLDWMRDKLASCHAKKVGFNLSGQSVGDPSFHAWAVDVLKAAGPVLCQALTLEITETVAIANLDQARTFLHAVRGLGLRVALDDFGSGAATFGYLKKLPLDYIKIDGQFVTGLLSDPLDEVTVRSFVDVARVMGLKTVAEFVESAEVMNRLRELGVDFAQGYHLHKPAPLDTLCHPATPSEFIAQIVPQQAGPAACKDHLDLLHR